jgi:4-hydroxy-2-oxoheptanedioate aldolase
VTPDQVRQKWRAGDVSYGLWTAIPDPFAAELSALSGLDYICVDQQHGVMDYSDLVSLLPAIERHGVLPITRVPANEPWLIGRSLDAGAMGVVVPMVSTAEQAAAAVAACRYSPHGIRSFGPIRAVIAAGSSDPRQLESVLCVVMVETVEGLANVEAIAATPGVDAIYVGPADLALSLGLEPKLEATEPRHAEAIAAIQKACTQSGIAAGIQCSDGAAARLQAQAGFQMVTVAKDSALLQAAVRRELRVARGGDAATGVGSYS